METIYASVTERKYINRGVLTGCFCPIYGFGAIIIIQSFKWTDTFISDHYISLFVGTLIAIVLVTVLEYVTGYLLEKIFKCAWWDYSNDFANIHGYICLKNSLLWGLFALILIQVIHPAISEMLLLTPMSIKSYIAAFVLLYFLTDTVKSVSETLDLRKIISNYSNFSVNKYYEKIIKYKRIFFAFPRLLMLNASIVNRDVRSILNDSFDKIKIEIRSRL
jgi:uncharacterized membrane protein